MVGFFGCFRGASIGMVGVGITNVVPVGRKHFCALRDVPWQTGFLVVDRTRSATQRPDTPTISITTPPHSAGLLHTHCADVHCVLCYSVIGLEI